MPSDRERLIYNYHSVRHRDNVGGLSEHVTFDILLPHNVLLARHIVIAVIIIVVLYYAKRQQNSNTSYKHTQ